MLPETFTPNYAIINSVTLDNIVSFEKLHDVKILLTGDAPKFAKSNRMHTKQAVRQKKDGTWLFTIPAIAAEVVVPWILSQHGEAVPIEPPELIEAVRKAARATLDSLPPS